MSGIEPYILNVLLAGSILPLAIGVIFRQGMFAFWLIGGAMIFLPFAFYDGVNVSHDVQSVTSNVTASLVETVDIVEMFTDTYTTNSGWTQVSTGVDVDSTVSDRLSFNLAGVSGDRRVHKSLGTVINTEDYFLMEFDFTYQSSSTPNEYVVALTANNNAISVAQDAIVVQYTTSTNTGLRVQSRDEGGAFAGCSTPVSMTGAGTTYYVTVERFNVQSIQLRVYSDSARTTLIGTNLCAMASDSIGGFTTIQHSHNTGTTSFVASVDNLVLSAGEISTEIVLSNGEEETYTYVDDTEAFLPEIRILMILLGLVIMFWGSWQQFFLE